MKSLLVAAVMMIAAGCSSTPVAVKETEGAPADKKDSGFAMGPNDTPPVAIEMARPVYPVHLRKAAIAGEVLVEFIVDRTGAVVSAKAVKSTNPDFEAAAVDAFMRSRFRPARRNGVPTGVRLQVPIYFSITRG